MNQPERLGVIDFYAGVKSSLDRLVGTLKEREFTGVQFHVKGVLALERDALARLLICRNLSFDLASGNRDLTTVSKRSERDLRVVFPLDEGLILGAYSLGLPDVDPESLRQRLTLTRTDRKYIDGLGSILVPCFLEEWSELFDISRPKEGGVVLEVGDPSKVIDDHDYVVVEASVQVNEGPPQVVLVIVREATTHHSPGRGYFPSRRGEGEGAPPRARDRDVEGRLIFDETEEDEKEDPRLAPSPARSPIPHQRKGSRPAPRVLKEPVENRFPPPGEEEKASVEQAGAIAVFEPDAYHRDIVREVAQLLNLEWIQVQSTRRLKAAVELEGVRFLYIGWPESVEMPEGLFQSLKALKRDDSFSIIAALDSPTRDAVIRSLQRGANSVIGKPFTHREWHQRPSPRARVKLLVCGRTTRSPSLMVQTCTSFWPKQRGRLSPGARGEFSLVCESRPRRDSTRSPSEDRE